MFAKSESATTICRTSNETRFSQMKYATNVPIAPILIIVAIPVIARTPFVPPQIRMNAPSSIKNIATSERNSGMFLSENNDFASNFVFFEVCGFASITTSSSDLFDIISSYKFRIFIVLVLPVCFGVPTTITIISFVFPKCKDLQMDFAFSIISYSFSSVFVKIAVVFQQSAS